MIIRHPEKINKPSNPIKKKPEWIRSKIINSHNFFLTKSIINKNNLNTVCQEANCPNITECWSKRHATFMIMGDTCTRACGFCDVKTGKPAPPDYDEPKQVGKSVALMGLRHIVITCVDRDDLPDGGAEIWAMTINAVNEHAPNTSVETLIGDFQGDSLALQKVIDAKPHILAHNLVQGRDN